MIERNIIDDLKETLSYFPVIGIVGPRQVGKTTLAKYLINIIEKESVYIDIENPKDLAKLTDPVLYFEQNRYKCVILDEIQRQPELFPIIRSMVDQNRVPARFIVLGSASPDLIRDSSESLAGRIAYEELTPFNLLEVHERSDIYHHWFVGGFPNAFLAPNNKIKTKWLSNFIQTYIEKDLPMLGLDVHHNLLRKFWVMIAHMHGSILNMNNLGRALEISSTSIKKYLSFLENAFLIRQLRPYSANVKKRLVKSPKVYIRDSGILHSLLDIRDYESLQANPILGVSWEGYVIEQICQLTDINKQSFFYRTHEGAECDLVLVNGGIVQKAIEIKYTSAPKLKKGTINAFEDIKAKENYIITPSTDDYLIDQNIRVCSLSIFLEKYIF